MTPVRRSTEVGQLDSRPVTKTGCMRRGEGLLTSNEVVFGRIMSFKPVIAFFFERSSKGLCLVTPVAPNAAALPLALSFLQPWA